MNKQSVKFSIKEAYNVVTGAGIESEIQFFFKSLNSNKAVFIVDGNVLEKQKHFVAKLRSFFDEAPLYMLEAGEASKDVNHWISMVDFCMDQQVSRTVPIIAIGGGVTGDAAGFVAATVLRGLPLVHIPTTLLAMVDSAIGGKTGVNHRAGKNLVGSFYHPRGVYADLNTLETLPDEEFICGFGEILKYGVIADPVILDVLKTRELLELRSNLNQLDSIIQRCIKIKSGIVNRDSNEASERMILNYGHTFAHAIEKILGYGTISHGQAVYIGMIAAGFLSELTGAVLNQDLIHRHVTSMKINPASARIKTSDLLEAMQSDKKKLGSDLRFILLQQYGRPYVTKIEDQRLIDTAWQKTTDFFNEQ